ncbi:MAG: hypothetical protein GY756_23500, partial [bacterium]|nr:hypothetical protein [bacterium]
MNFRNKRIKLLIFLFIFWLILIFIAQYSRSINTTDKSKLSEYTGIIVPERGKIFDKNGKILSQYKKYYNLYVNDNISTSKLIYIKTKLHKILPKTQFSKESNTQHILVKRNLSENDITNLTNLLTQYPFLIIKVEFKKNKI